jgi:hypothetical protein
MVQSLYCHRLHVVLQATAATRFDAWPGAFLRANLEHAAAAVRVDDRRSLFDVITSLPLDPAHPLYGNFQTGFPRGFTLALPEDTPPEMEFQPGDQLQFELCLIGNMSRYFIAFIEAIRRMAEVNGMGHPRIPFELLSVGEILNDTEARLLTADGVPCDDRLIRPFTCADFQNADPDEDCRGVEVEFTAPVILSIPAIKKNRMASYQDKSHGFPGLHQLTRSALHRFFHLDALYRDVPQQPATREKLVEDFFATVLPNVRPYENEDAGHAKDIDNYIAAAAAFTLIDCDLREVRLKNTPKKGRVAMPLRGYVGMQRYARRGPKTDSDFGALIPALKFMEIPGVGGEVVYGLGRYRINYFTNRSLRNS